MSRAAFNNSQAAGRFVGDYWIGRFGPIDHGIGIANLVPILFGAAGRAHHAGAGPGLATVTTTGYFGFLSGPPVMGALAAFAGLPLAL